MDTGPLSPSLTSRLPPLDVTVEEAAQLGYMPLRDDFERVKDFLKNFWIMQNNKWFIQ